MTHAVVLIEAQRSDLATLGGALADIEGVAEAYSVTGPWDFVAIVRVHHHEQLAEVIAGQIGSSRESRGRRPWSPLRPSRATTWSPCSPSGSRRRTAVRGRARPPAGAPTLAPAVSALPVKPEYGPTLGQLLAPGWRARSHTARRLLIVAAVGGVALLAGAALSLLDATYSHGGGTPFGFHYRGLYRTAPAPGELVRIVRYRRGRLQDLFAVAPLALAPYRGSSTAELPLYAAHRIEELSRRYRGFDLVGEGEVKVNTVPGYSIYFRLTLDGRTLYGRDTLVVKDQPSPRAGVIITEITVPGAIVTSPTLVGGSDVLQTPLHSFTLR